MHLTVAMKKKVHVEFTILFFANSKWYQSVFSEAKIFNLFLGFLFFSLTFFFAIIFFLVLKFFEKKGF